MDRLQQYHYQRRLGNIISGLKEIIENEKLLEKSYTGQDQNPHTKKIESLQKYLVTLEAINTTIGYAG